MLRKLASGVRIINIDQSFINESNFISRRWFRKGEINTMNERVVTPRIALMTAIDTQGSVWLSLSAVNSTSNQFCMFMSRLAEKLTK